MVHDSKAKVVLTTGVDTMTLLLFCIQRQRALAAGSPDIPVMVC